MRKRPAPLLAALLLWCAGCGYQLSGQAEVFNSGELEGVRRVAVAPFAYPYDWTGYFRDIYRKAGVPAPPGSKVDRIEATFLVEEALAARGYEPLPWPGGEEAPPVMPSKALLGRLREGGHPAMLAARGDARCESVDACTARVSLTLWSTEGERLWSAEASASTLIHQGDEMKAAIQEALSGLPRRR
ncbi:MAG: hypothetical protein HYZ11_05420 [Candidatus Tectomicrobia bacterium]|uniref:DUF4136 domain-containing protein n=1 Tax=Tectimicrobiota bacterium TaxID=2528274 RepID=A0A932HYY0_UNCTE|nr:hypothetical protein [Candidatus Tectomicrobia bacterium]